MYFRAYDILSIDRSPKVLTIRIRIIQDSVIRIVFKGII